MKKQKQTPSKLIKKVFIISFFVFAQIVYLNAQIIDDNYEAAEAASRAAIQQEKDKKTKRPEKVEPIQKEAKGKYTLINDKRLEKIISNLLEKMGKSFYKTLKCKEKFFLKFKKNIVFQKSSCVNFPDKILITSLNVYSENTTISNIRLFSKKLTTIKVPKYKFEIKRSKSTFKFRQIINAESYRIVRGPIDNTELTKFVLAENFEYYAEFYLYITPKRVLLEAYIFDAKTHRLQWSNWEAVRYDPFYLKFSAGLAVNFLSKPTFTMLKTTIGWHIPNFGEFDFYFDFGFSSNRNPSLKQSSLARDNIHVGVALGGMISLYMVEMITQKAHCCDFVITAAPGMFFQIPLLSNEIEEESKKTTLQTIVNSNFIIPVGIKIPIENFSIMVTYEPMKNTISTGVSYNF